MRKEVSHGVRTFFELLYPFLVFLFLGGGFLFTQVQHSQGSDPVPEILDTSLACHFHDGTEQIRTDRCAVKKLELPYVSNGIEI